VLDFGYTEDKDVNKVTLALLFSPIPDHNMKLY